MAPQRAQDWALLMAIGLRVKLVEPGGVDTDFAGRSFVFTNDETSFGVLLRHCVVRLFDLRSQMLVVRKVHARRKIHGGARQPTLRRLFLNVDDSMLFNFNAIHS